MVNLSLCQFLQKYKKENSNNSFEQFSSVADNKYLKRYQLNTKLAKHNVINTRKSLDFTHEEDDLLLGLKSVHMKHLMIMVTTNEYVLFDLVVNKKFV